LHDVVDALRTQSGILSYLRRVHHLKVCFPLRQLSFDPIGQEFLNFFLVLPGLIDDKSAILLEWFHHVEFVDVAWVVAGNLVGL